MDVLYGGIGDDRLVGDTRNDFLFGGAGFDTYVYATNDDHDRIEDSDATGVIIVNGQMLAGGIKKKNEATWKSPDGTIEYGMSGMDLVVKRNGDTILTVNENFQSGQFGIRLIDATGIVDDAGPAINYATGQPTISWDGDAPDNTAILTAPGNYLAHGFRGNDIINLERSGALFNYQIYGGAGHDRIYGRSRVFMEYSIA